jgi:thiol-disulfide isomerase/thioredoxin
MTQNAPARDKGSGEGGNSNRVVILLAGLTVVVIAAIAAFAFALGGSGGGGSVALDENGLISAGSQAPGFTAETLNGGGSVTVGGDGDEAATLLVFFASWCPHCQAEAPTIAELEKEYEGDLRVVMAGIDETQGDTPEKVRGFVERFGIEGPAVYEPALGEEYQVAGYPTLYVLDGEGKVVDGYTGEVPKETLEASIQEAI